MKTRVSMRGNGSIPSSSARATFSVVAAQEPVKLLGTDYNRNDCPRICLVRIMVLQLPCKQSNLGSSPRRGTKQLRVRKVEIRGSHKPLCDGSIPSSATKYAGLA